jgi:hypothetical protein
MTDYHWTPRYSGPGKSGICRCGHRYTTHHCGIVMNDDYYRQTGETVVPGECEFYGCNEFGGLDADGKLHCGNYVDRGVRPDRTGRKLAIAARLSAEMRRLQHRWAVLLGRKMRVMNIR